MNCLADNVNNLIVIKANNYQEDLYRLCLEKVQKGLLVLILTSTTYDFSELSRNMKITKVELKRLIAVNYSKINDVSQKLMDLHDWNLLPSLVVVDISDLLLMEFSAISVSTPTIMKTVGLCAASLLNYLQTVSLQKRKRTNDEDATVDKVNGVFIVRTDEEKFSDEHLQLLKNLYFYKNVSFVDAKQLIGFLRSAT